MTPRDPTVDGIWTAYNSEATEQWTMTVPGGGFNG
jgi:hypothetical protein